MNDTEITELLRTAKVVAVVGLSSNPMRPSFGVSRFLQRQGFRIIPVNPNETEVLGERAYSSVTAIPEAIDIVNIFRRPARVPEIVEEAIAKGARCVWMQEGVVNHDAARKAEAAGMPVVMDRCILKELARLLPY
ncbi:MAG: CoA-binding protein [Acidobacteriaceae bacterium]|nr:CoA-binding protein [Acidobacteriaceae bacterium]